MQKVLVYFGLDGSVTPTDWAHSAAGVLPPIILAPIAGRLDGVGGAAGWALSAVYLVVAWAVWWPLITRLAARRGTKPGG